MLDNLKVHHSKRFLHWVNIIRQKLLYSFHCTYTTQCNLDEYLNNDLKRNINKRRIHFIKDELKSNLKSYLRLP